MNPYVLSTAIVTILLAAMLLFPAQLAIVLVTILAVGSFVFASFVIGTIIKDFRDEYN